MARDNEGNLPDRDRRPMRQSVKKLLDTPTWTPKQNRKKADVTDKSSAPKPKPKTSGGQKRTAGDSEETSKRGREREREAKRVKTMSQNKGSAHGKVRKYLPPKTIVTDGEESDEDEFPESIQRERQKIKVQKVKRREEGEEEDEEGSDEERSEDFEPDENERSLDDATNLFDESVVIKDHGHQKRQHTAARTQGANRRARSRSASRSNQYRSDQHEGPPTTDDDDSFNRDNDEEHEEGNANDSEAGSGDDLERELFTAARSRGGRQVTEKRRQAVNKKLEEERPIITARRRLSDGQTSEDDGEGDDDDDCQWTPRSVIQLSYQNSTPRVNIKDQSGIMQAVIRRAVDLGEVYLVLGAPTTDTLSPEEAATMNTPFSISGLHSIAITALVSAAQEHGYDKQGDIVDRLTNGSERKYIKPLRTHVFQRLSLARSQILSKITSALPSVIKVDKSSKVVLGWLLTKSSYIFPLKEGSQDKFITAKAYQSEIITESLKIGFGLLENVHVPKLYVSTHPDFEQEREIPPQMVALAATTDHAILQHLLYDGAGNINDFSTPALQSVFQAHMVRLLEWKRRHPRLFHKYMHQQYKTVIGIGAGVVGDQTTDDIINEVDWDNMMDSDDGPMGGV